MNIPSRRDANSSVKCRGEGGGGRQSRGRCRRGGSGPRRTASAAETRSGDPATQKCLLWGYSRYSFCVHVIEPHTATLKYRGICTSPYRLCALRCRWDGDDLASNIYASRGPSITIYVRPILKNKIPFVIDGRDYT